MKKKICSIPFQLLLSVFLALSGAALFGPLPAMEYTFSQVGSIFIELLKMLVVPLAFIAITNAVIRMGASRIRDLSYKFIGLTLAMSLFGFAIGFGLMTVLNIPPFPLTDVSVKEAVAPSILEFIRGCIPVNPFNSLVKGNMLQVLTLTFFIGFAVMKLSKENQKSVVHGFDVCQEILIKIANFIMHLAPIGVFCLLYPVVAKSMTNLITVYVQMICMMILGSLIYMVVCSIPLLFLFKVNHPIQFFKTIIVQDIVGAIAGGASNYMAPRIDNLKKNTAIAPEVIDFFIPITSVLTRMGSTICVGIYTVFAAYIFHVTLSPMQIILAGFLTVIALMCAPGIIGGTLMDCAIIWAAIGIPVEAIAFIAGIDYVIDVLRTVLNIQGGEIITACLNRFNSNLTKFKLRGV